MEFRPDPAQFRTIGHEPGRLVTLAWLYARKGAHKLDTVSNA